MDKDLFKTGVRPLIDAYLLEESKKVRDYGQYWSASSAGYCMRKVIFDRMGVPEVNADSKARKQRVFSAGHIFHEWIQDITIKARVSVAQEVELIDDSIMVKGHFDDLIMVNGELILYDYKTVNSRSFMWTRKQEKESGEKQPMSYFHRLQLGTYLYMLRNGVWPKTTITEVGTQIKDIKEARILKIEKDTLTMGEQQLIWDESLMKDVDTYWQTLNRYWRAGKIPACTCAEYEGGFMAKELYNPYFYGGEPCSLAWLELCRTENRLIKKGDNEGVHNV